MQKLCSGDWDRTLQFSVYDWNRLAGINLILILFIIILLITRSGNHELIGKNTCTLRDITIERCSVFLCALRIQSSRHRRSVLNYVYIAVEIVLQLHGLNCWVI